MSGKGTCPCCKKTSDLTEHHDKEINAKIMMCGTCHGILEEYQRIQQKIVELVPKKKS